jgi:hypothetical protein
MIREILDVIMPSYPEAWTIADGRVPRKSVLSDHLRRGHCLPMRGNSQLIIFRYGSPLDGIRSIAS